MTTNWSEADLAALGFRKDGTRDPALYPGKGENKAGNPGGAACMPAPSMVGPAGGAGERSSPPAGANKFGAVRTVAPASWGGERWADSRTGASLSSSLMAQRRSGAIVDFYEEVSIPIGVTEQGRIVRYRADAMVLLGYVDMPGGEPAMVIRLLDAKRKNMDTTTSKAKRAALRQRGLNVQVV